jgi:oligosaccharide translocation protein RFT1
MTPAGPSSEHNDLFRASFSSVYSLVALQLVSRLFTFCLNQAMLRMASPRAFGTSIQFELLVSTVLFLSREGVRNALLRARPMGRETKEQSSDASSESQATSNLSRLPFVFGLPLTVAASWLYRCLANVTTRSQPHFDMAVNLYALAVVIELLSEPMHNWYELL